MGCVLQQGSKHGVGTYVWPNGATYKGEWLSGCMHGVGSFTSPDGTFYEAGRTPCQTHAVQYPLAWSLHKQLGPLFTVLACNNRVFQALLAAR